MLHAKSESPETGKIGCLNSKVKSVADTGPPRLPDTAAAAVLHSTVNLPANSPNLVDIPLSEESDGVGGPSVRFSTPRGLRGRPGIRSRGRTRGRALGLKRKECWQESRVHNSRAGSLQRLQQCSQALKIWTSRLP
ncbi:hypothetical protein Salat_2494300 [Sesamum alatum]|uniref:Uncharacterized protein n=1 Tax=Sesamum alatum TaxID=300844 RepID=A0AAE2CC33_9LAMI|nr:hypothetical protein Salat_2494300 [Sesamum alatum]